jgi:hypothetical protein
VPYDRHSCRRPGIVRQRRLLRPVFPIVGWGIAVVLNAWDVYGTDEFAEKQIRSEMEHLQGQR